MSERINCRAAAYLNSRLKTDVENARLSGSLIRHGLAALRYVDSELAANAGGF